MLRDSQAKKITQLLDAGEINSGGGQNQEQNLQALSTTRGNCQLKLVENLRNMFAAAIDVVEWASTDAYDAEKRAEVLFVHERATTFEFALCLFLLIEVLSKTCSLSQCLQRKNHDILNALRLVRSTKRSLQILRDSGWNIVKNSAIEFCGKHNIVVPTLNENWIALGRPRRYPAGYVHRTIDDHYRIDLFNTTIDSLLTELNHRFSCDSCELLGKIPYLDPGCNFESYHMNQSGIIELAVMYKDNFTATNRVA